MERKIFELKKKIKTRNYQRLNKLQNAKKPQRSSSKIVTSEAFQRMRLNKLQNAKKRNVLAPKLLPLKHFKG